MQNIFKPGTDDNPAGKYVEVNGVGKPLKNARHTTIKQGEKLPPTQESGNMWQMV